MLLLSPVFVGLLVVVFCCKKLLLLLLHCRHQLLAQILSALFAVVQIAVVKMTCSICTLDYLPNVNGQKKRSPPDRTVNGQKKKETQKPRSHKSAPVVGTNYPQFAVVQIAVKMTSIYVGIYPTCSSFVVVDGCNVTTAFVDCSDLFSLV